MCKVLCKEQYGFRKNKSTSDAVNELLTNIYDDINKGEHFGAIFLDLSKAFDTVSHDILLAKLEHYGIRGTSLKLLESYLTNRKQYVTVNGHKSQTQVVNIGVPQGSVLGPLLFLIYINDLPLSTNNMKSILFADDTTFFTSHKDIHNLSQKMTDELLLVKEWLISNCLILNVNKTYYMIFSTRSIPNNIRISIGENLIERKASGKFLGMLLDDKLTFKEHINSIKCKVSKMAGILYKLKDKFPLEILHKLYYSLIYPHLIYCILAWGSAKSTYLSPLLMLQKRIVRILTNSSYYAHSDPLFKQLCLLKVKDLYEMQCQIFMHKTMKLNNYPVYKEKISTFQIEHNYGTRGSLLRTPFYRTEICKQSLLYQGIKNWNNLPEDIKNSTLNNIKKHTKNLKISRYISH